MKYKYSTTRVYIRTASLAFITRNSSEITLICLVINLVCFLKFYAGGPYKNLTHKVEAIDKENFVYSYSVIEGDALSHKFEKISYETKLESSGGGSVIKSVSKYYTKGDFEVKEEQVKDAKEKASGLLKAVEAYLLPNPDVYN